MMKYKRPVPELTGIVKRLFRWSQKYRKAALFIIYVATVAPEKAEILTALPCSLVIRSLLQEVI